MDSGGFPLFVKDVEGFPDYQIYTDGRVWSKRSSKYLKPRQDRGYLRVKLNRKWKMIHRLVAENFIPNPLDLPEVDHINRIKEDNRIENLRWLSKKDNQSNRKIPKNNTTGFKWINHYSPKNCYRFVRKDCKEKKSKDLSKLLCYSFFYLLKNPILYE